MRLSVDKSDAGYHDAASICSARVLFNGEPLRDCVTADEDKGEAVILVRNERDHIRTKDGEAMRVTVCGRVEIEFKPGWRERIRNERVQTVAA